VTAVVPVDSLARRIPIVAKLKSGAKTANGAPKSIDKWRATTSSRPWAENFANRYGGEVKAFTAGNSPHQWEVFSDAAEVSIALLDEGYSIAYELWSAGGCQRRCDGVTASVLSTTGPDNVEYVDSPCICDRKGVLECSLKSRLTFVMPDLPFAGGCVYETSSKNFAEESQGMLALIQQMQARGVTRGVLRLEQRKSSGGRRYTIAVVGVSESLDGIASGRASVGSIGTAPERPELSSPASSPGLVEDGEPASPSGSPTSSSGVEGEAAPEEALAGGREVRQRPVTASNVGSSPTLPADDEDIVDAEIVEDDEPPPFRLDKSERSKMRSAFMARTKNDLGLDYDTQTRPWLVAKYGGGWSDLTDEQVWSLYNALVVPEGSRQEKDDAAERFKKAVLKGGE
jgi:hypothetical protein